MRLDRVEKWSHASGMPSWDGSKGSIEALHRYWNSRAGGRAPQRNDIEPADIKPLLPFLYIVRYEREPFRVRYILTGTEADRWNGFNLTGRYVDEFLGTDINGANRILLDAYTKAFETAAPVFGTYSWPTRAGYSARRPLRHVPFARRRASSAMPRHRGLFGLLAGDGRRRRPLREADAKTLRAHQHLGSGGPHPARIVRSASAKFRRHVSFAQPQSDRADLRPRNTHLPEPAS